MISKGCVIQTYMHSNETMYLWVSSKTETFNSLLAFEGYRPRVVTVEYNSNYLLNDALTIMDPTLIGNGSVPPGTLGYWHACATGASAKALLLVARTFGYQLVGRVAHLDLVFLRSDLLADDVLIPEDEWFFRDAELGGLYHETAWYSIATLSRIVDYETYLQTNGDFYASNLAAKKILLKANIPCFPIAI